MTRLTLIWIPVLLLVLAFSPAPQEADAASMSSVSLQVLPGDVIRLEGVIHWNLFTDPRSQNWDLIVTFYGVDSGHYDLLFNYGSRVIRGTNGHQSYGIAFANTNRRFNEDGGRDEIRATVRLRHNGVTYASVWTNTVTGRF